MEDQPMSIVLLYNSDGVVVTILPMIEAAMLEICQIGCFLLRPLLLGEGNKGKPQTKLLAVWIHSSHIKKKYTAFLGLKTHERC